ncbi:MAG: lysine exporter LysO family protein [Bacillota bacterium]
MRDLDFYLILVFLLSGIFIGFKAGEENFLINISDKISNFGLIVLLTSMGTNLGSSDEIVHQLGKIGLQSFIFAAASIGFSLGFLILFSKKLNFDNFLLTGKEETVEETSEGSMTGMIFSSVIIGILAGYFWLPESFYIFVEPITNYSLAVLLFGVGINIGASREVLNDLRLMGWQILLIPVIIAVGSLAGTLLTGMIMGYPGNQAAAVGAGFGWYSLSGVLLSELHSAQLGSVAFLSNVFRELLTVLILPFVAKYFGRMATIAPGGATTMDVTLPLVKQSGGEAVVIPAFISGVVLTALVPVLVPFLINK